MARTPRWTETGFDRGVVEIRLSAWKYFSDYVNQELLDYTTYIYRGHGNAAWKLEPTLDRIVKGPTSPRREAHLEKFKLETRGRRGANPPTIVDENDWWALGRHHGLATPLLDWTESPFVALYFAALAAQKENARTISVVAASQISIELRKESILSSPDVAEINDRKPTVRIVRPQSDENSRLVSQRGLFTRGPNNMDLETWMKEFYKERHHTMELITITIPRAGIQDCLRYLNRMNINHATLCPDLTGASEFCNRHLTLSRY